MQAAIDDETIEDTEEPFLSYLIQDEDGDGIIDETGEKMSKFNFKKTNELKALMKKDLFDFLPDDAIQFTLSAEQGSLSIFESFEWEEERRITAFY